MYEVDKLIDATNFTNLIPDDFAVFPVGGEASAPCAVLAICAVQKIVTAPPADAVDGQHFAISTGSGAFAGHDGQHARRNSSNPAGWDFYTPAEGDRFLNLDASDRQVYEIQSGAAVAVGAKPQQLVPPGVMLPYGGAAAPTGWLLCDGSSYLRATYAGLFAAIGTAYGAADGTHFNVPDLRGRAPYGLGPHADVDALGDSDGVAAASRTPNHTHAIAQSEATTGTPGAALNAAAVTGAGNPGFLVVNYIIKL